MGDKSPGYLKGSQDNFQQLVIKLVILFGKLTLERFELDRHC